MIVHCSPFVAEDVIELNGVRLTSLARTVIDLARSRPLDQAVASGDRAIAIGLNRISLDQALIRMKGWPHVRQARRVVAFLDGRCESVGESLSRVRIADDGLPTPELQRQIIDARGRQVGRVDFCWQAQRTIGEFDGKMKYGRMLKPGQSSEEAIFAEKVREDDLRDNGWQVARWLWRDIYRPGVIRDRLLRAFERAS